MTTITIKEYLENPSAYYLTDVRTPNEFEEAHIEQAHMHPLDGLNAGEIRFKAQGKKVVLTCLTGARCKKAASALKKSGIELFALDGSLQAWEKAGHPVVRGVPKGLPLIRQVHITVGSINLIAAVMCATVSPLWIWVLIATACGLLLAGTTGFCGLGVVLAKMPWNRPAKDVEACSEG
ncbi:rhodanese-like domain-containing protein [Rubritalea tangerina]|uniref:Rhodanese-like domain-containing protein n=1 Tax=Rubritalea tangerina TaxID=430798 RepID=A0ABW4Z6Y3_9BACT